MAAAAAAAQQQQQQQQRHRCLLFCRLLLSCLAGTASIVLTWEGLWNLLIKLNSSSRVAVEVVALCAGVLAHACESRGRGLRWLAKLFLLRGEEVGGGGGSSVSPPPSSSSSSSSSGAPLTMFADGFVSYLHALLSIGFWWGLWTVEDAVLFPSSPSWSCIASLLIGFGSLLWGNATRSVLAAPFFLSFDDDPSDADGDMYYGGSADGPLPPRKCALHVLFTGAVITSWRGVWMFANLAFGPKWQASVAALAAAVVVAMLHDSFLPPEEGEGGEEEEEAGGIGSASKRRRRRRRVLSSRGFYVVKSIVCGSFGIWMWRSIWLLAEEFVIFGEAGSLPTDLAHHFSGVIFCASLRIVRSAASIPSAINSIVLALGPGVEKTRHIQAHDESFSVARLANRPGKVPPTRRLRRRRSDNDLDVGVLLFRLNLAANLVALATLLVLGLAKKAGVRIHSAQPLCDSIVDRLNPKRDVIEPYIDQEGHSPPPPPLLHR